MYLVNKNIELTEPQRKMIEDQLNSSAGHGFAKHSSHQRSVRILESKGFCKAQYAIERGLLWDLTVTMKITKSLPFATMVDISPKEKN